MIGPHCVAFTLRKVLKATFKSERIELARSHDQRPQECGPPGGELNRGERCQSWARERQYHQTKYAERGRAVDMRRVFEFARQRAEELAQQENPVRGDQLRHDQALVDIQPGERLERTDSGRRQAAGIGQLADAMLRWPVDDRVGRAPQTVVW
jgi:hypothetical protein